MTVLSKAVTLIDDVANFTMKDQIEHIDVLYDN